MSDAKTKIEQNRRDFILSASVLGMAGAYMATAGFNPAMADELVSRRVEVTFVARPPARQIAAAVGVSDVEIVDRRVRCLVRGSFQPLLEACVAMR